MRLDACLLGAAVRDLDASKALLLLLLCGCGTGFVEPNPPRLSRVTARFSPEVVEEPTVWALLWDVHLPSPEDCTQTRERFGKRLRELFEKDSRELTAVADLSPACQQPFERRLDLATLEASVREAELAFAPRRVRPILVYLNNVDLPLPAALAKDLEAVQRNARARGAPVPFVWSFAAPAVLEQLELGPEVDWSYASDPALLESLGKLAADTVPIVSRRATSVEPMPLLEPAQLARAAQLKACTWDARASAVNLLTNGSAVAVDRQHPPSYRVLLPELSAVPRFEASVQPLELSLELCEASCDRYLVLDGGQWVRWSTTPRCLLPAPKQEAKP